MAMQYLHHRLSALPWRRLRSHSVLESPSAEWIYGRRIEDSIKSGRVADQVLLSFVLHRSQSITLFHLSPSLLDPFVLDASEAEAWPA
jgi:hypothetical protein